MTEISLEVLRREESGKGVARKLRQNGKIPAVVYGGHRDSVAITVDRKSVSELIQKSEHGIRSIFLLKMSDSDQQRHAMIKEVQIDPISRKMTHIDFVRVVMDEVVRVMVPVHISGIAAGVKNGGGLLDWQVRELHVECLPNAIPDAIDVDVTALDGHEYYRISDLKLPEGVKILDDEERVVVGITHAKLEALPEPEVAAVVVEPELIKKGKPEGEA
ncbi:MAG: 50S ribosomal protein L25 [Acidobacteriota bacterium]